MKVLSVEQWMVCPIGTIYAEWTPATIISEWSVKGSTGPEDISLYDTGLLDLPEDPDGQKLPCEEFCYSRATGCYEGDNRMGRPHQFIVLEKEDLERLKARIDLCLLAQAGDTGKIGCP